MIEVAIIYKKTGNEWVPEIPEHWDFRRLKNFAEIGSGQDQKGIENDNGKYSIYGTGGLMGKTNEFLYEGPSVILGRKGTIDNPFYVTEPFWTVDTAYYTKIKENVDPRFFFYCCLTIQFDYYKYGSAVPSLSQRDLNQIRLPYPPLEEQKVIADYLDTQSAKIARFIQTKQRFIELLKEQRQGIVSNIVTKGLGDHSNLINSGFDWLGSIPNHWKMIRVKNVFDLVTEPAPAGNSEVLLSIYSAIGVKPRKEMEQRGNKSTTTDGYWKVKRGDIIVNKLLAWMGAIGISEYDGVTSPAYDILRLKINGSPFYYSELFRNSNIRGEFKKYSKGIMDVRLRLYFTEFGKIFIPVFPKDEQERIVEHIKTETRTLDIAIAKAEKEIEIIKEYREAMIAEAVTGKMKL